MRAKVQKHIERIQQHPEHKKQRIVFMYTIIASLIVVLVWVFLLLPAQLQLAE